MNARYWIAIALLAVQCAAMLLMTKSYPYPLAMFVLAALAPVAAKYVPLRARSMIALSVFMAVVLIAYAQRTTEGYSYTVWFPSYAMAIAFGRFFLFAEVLVVIGWFRKSPTPFVIALLPFLGILAMTCIGNVSSISTPADRFRLLSLLFAAFIAAYFASSLRHSTHGKTRAHLLRWTLNLGFVGITLAIAFGVGAAIQQYGNELNRLFGMAAGGSSSSVTGFTKRARLDSMTRMRGGGDSKTALRVVADEPPGYLRGIAYDTYAPPEWRVTGEVEALKAAEKPPAGLPRIAAPERWYQIRQDNATAWKKQSVWRAAPLEGALFAPLDTSWIGAPCDDVAIDQQCIARADSAPAEYTNAISGLPDKEPLSDEMRKALTQLPDSIDPRIPELARQLTQGVTTDSEKIAAVLGYFQGFKYSMDIHIPAANDPLVFFLLQKPPAHCEFFAAGATVLLRAAGVPSRYVVGFMVTEHNSLGGYWCARNRDAHAWCEAYDSVHGWTTVDATPPAGRPTGKNVARVAALWDSARFYAGRALESLTDGIQRAVAGFPTAAAALARILFATPWGIAMAAVCAAASAAYVRLRWTRKRKARRSDGFEEGHQLLDTMDRRMAKAGFQRAPSETLERFCLRVLASPLPNVAQIAEWYRAYMRVRYGRRQPGESLELLRSTMPSPRQPAQ